ncbi:hypothetical protein VI26_06680, partial [Chromobacterium sp. LK1]|uniref:hypothetical protein n=1 Tax=Chromobacterium sp. LK1 TaxID=1628193 RepID=UPI000652E300
MQITKVLLKQWSACREGYQWFIAKFPAGEGSYHDIVVALYDDKRAADARWLSAKCFEHFGDEFLPVEMASIDAVSASIINSELPEGELNSSGDDAQIGSS